VRYALLVVAGGILFGTTGTTGALAPAGATPLSVGAVRLAFGGLLLAAIGVVAHVAAKRSGRAGFGPGRRITGRDVLAVVVCASVIMIFQPTFLQGTRANGVMVGTMIALGSSPMFAGLFEWLVLRQRPRVSWLVATAISVGGIVAMSRTGGLPVRISPGGVADSLVAGACYATLAVGAKWLLGRGWKPLDVAVASMTIGAAMALVTLTRTDISWVAQPRGMAVAAWLAVATIAAAYTLNMAGLAHTSAAAATTLNLAEPATATLLSLVVLGEAVTPDRILGIACIVSGVLLLGFAARRGGG